MEAEIARYARPIEGEGAPNGDLLEALQMLEPCIIGQEVIDDGLLNTLRLHAGGDSPQAAQLTRLLQHLDNFDHALALPMLHELLSQAGHTV